MLKIDLGSSEDAAMAEMAARDLYVAMRIQRVSRSEEGSICVRHICYLAHAAIEKWTKVSLQIAGLAWKRNHDLGELLGCWRDQGVPRWGFSDFGSLLENLENGCPEALGEKFSERMRYPSQEGLSLESEMGGWAHCLIAGGCDCRRALGRLYKHLKAQTEPSGES